MIKLYVADISHLPDPLSQPELIQQLSAERQQKIHNAKQVKSRKQSMGAGLLLQKVLALYHMETSPISLGKQGKPMVEGLEFNLSHSENLVICAVSEQAVGCDVEHIRKAPKGVAERFFSGGEQEYLRQFSGGDYDRAFFRLWTMKESYVKMTGEGFGVPMGAYEMVIGEEAEVYRDGKLQDCYMSEIEVDGYIISICAKDSAQVEIVSCHC